MASNQIVGFIYQTVPPATVYATPGRRAGGSTPNENIPVWFFDGTVQTEYLDFYGQMTSSYGGGGITLQIKWSATSVTSGSVRWEAAFRRVADDAEDLDVSQSYDYNSVISTTTNVAGEVKYATITFTDGADMDNVVANDMFILRVRRVFDDADDTITEDCQLHYVVIQET